MDRPDTILELRRDVVQDKAARIYSGDTYAESISGTGFTAQADVTLSLQRVWFLHDAVVSLPSQDPYLRLWQELQAGATEDPLRHFAITLDIADSNITIESVACIPLVPLPPRTITIPNGPRAGESLEIDYNVIPLFGSLTLHDHLEVRDAEVGTKTIVLDMKRQDAPVLVATPVDGDDSQLFGPEVERRADGTISFGGQDPKVTWDIDYAEAYWITHSIVGELLVAFERAQNPGMSVAAARVATLDLIAEELADAVRPKLVALGPDGVLDLLPDPGDHIAVDPTAQDDSTYKDLDVIVHRYGPPAAPQESMVAQLKTIRELPVGEDLPASILAERPDEPIGLATTGFGILLSVRETAMKSFELSIDDFLPDVPCELAGTRTVEISGEDVSLHKFTADIIEGDPTVLRIEGDLSQSTTLYDWSSPFSVEYVMKLDDIPRDQKADEPGDYGSQTMAQLDQDQQAAVEAKAAGTLSSTGYELEIKRIEEAFANLPRTVGVQPTLRGAPVVDPEFDLTAAGYALVAVAVAGVIAFVIVLPAGASLGISALTNLAAVGGLIVLTIVEYVTTLVVVDWYGGVSVGGKIKDALAGKRDGESVPAQGIPISVDLNRQRLAVFARPLPPRLDVRCIKPDSHEDADEVIQLIGGEWPGDGAQWRLSDSDGALLVRGGALELFVAADVAGGTEQRIGVSSSIKDRLFLRTDPDPAMENNLAGLPRCLM